ncbi:MAG: alpha-D-ribose 1-methylphosphonate 5-triphosphate diphosphatase [Deltaproteobacteria bacterium]|nr:alpha-D-ribose 1-methylphosphonate 5-triphosphate diphosphatase [Deltaproteobacteria bacterium]
MKKEIIFTHAQVVTPDEVFRGAVRVTDGKIHTIDRGRSKQSAYIDLEGDFLLPGLIELHTDNLEKHFSPRPGVRWPSMAAILSHDASVVAAGITTVLDALAVGDTLEDSARLRDLREMADAVKSAQKYGFLRAEHLLHMRCEIGYPQVLEMFDFFLHDPDVKLVSLMDHTPGQRQFTKVEKLFQYYQGRYGLTVGQMERLIHNRQKNQKTYASKHRTALVEMCRKRGIPLASHDDTTLDHVMESASEGIVICEFPTTVEAAEAARNHGLSILMGCPNLVLGGSHSGNVSALELARRGLLDILSSDYVPASLIHGAFLLHQELGISLPDAFATVTVNPARIAKLDDRGSIQSGKRADLIQVRMDHTLPVVRKVWRCGERVF